jgi:hypothetical protein
MLEEIVDVAVEIGHDPDQGAAAEADGERHEQPKKEVAKENLHGGAIPFLGPVLK